MELVSKSLKGPPLSVEPADFAGLFLSESRPGMRSSGLTAGTIPPLPNAVPDVIALSTKEPVLRVMAVANVAGVAHHETGRDRANDVLVRPTRRTTRRSFTNQRPQPALIRSLDDQLSSVRFNGSCLGHDSSKVYRNTILTHVTEEL